MTRKIRDLLPEAEQTGLSRLVRCLDDDGPIVVWLCGPAGAGKSALFRDFADQAGTRNVRVIEIDCRTVEPTVAGLLDELTNVLGKPAADLEDAAERLSALADRVIIAFSNYEVFRLADSWLRRDFIPTLSETARVVLISREPPAAGWVSATEWRDYFLAISLQAGEDTETSAYADGLLDDLNDEQLRSALDAAAVVRRLTKPMLAALLPSANADELYDRLAGNRCIETRRDGLALSETVRRIVADRLRAADHERYRGYQKAAWRRLRQQLKESARADLWRCTADIIYLIENPVIREAFFPSETARFSVEPAVPGDEASIFEITDAHEPAATKIMRLWWQHLPAAFHIVRDSSGLVAGYSCVALPHQLAGDWMKSDPVARRWQHHVGLRGRAAQPPSLFLRRWLSREDGEAPSAVQAAAWVDVKRTYLELRPELRRVYLTLRDVAPYGAVATQLGFQVLADLEARIGDSAYCSAMLDFGPGSVDGWICNLLAAELGIAEDQLLDTSTRELIAGDQRIPLTPLEFSLVSMLEGRAGEPVSRSELLREVWGHGYEGGSNVVDALVRGLRKKCGESASMIETVRGVGYRLRT
jgi:hypothetical protein